MVTASVQAVVVLLTRRTLEVSTGKTYLIISTVKPNPGTSP